MRSTRSVTQRLQTDTTRSPNSSDWGESLFRHIIDQAVLAELDRRYWAFVEALPSRLVQLAADRRTITGRGSSQRLQTVAEIEVGLTIPWTFREAFPRVNENQLLDVGEAWLFLLMAIFLRDHIADDQIPVNSDTNELLHRLMVKVRSIFVSLVGTQAAFWQRFEQYEEQVTSALRLEAEYRTLPEATYDLKMARQIGIGKGALYKAPVCAMAVLSEELSSFVKVERSMNALAAGRQLFDDVTDWQEDLARGHYTYPLVQAIIRLEASSKPISQQDIEKEIFQSTIREDALRQARAWHQESLRAVDGIPCQDWVDLINNCLVDCISEHYRLTFYRTDSTSN